MIFPYSITAWLFLFNQKKNSWIYDICQCHKVMSHVCVILSQLHIHLTLGYSIFLTIWGWTNFPQGWYFLRRGVMKLTGKNFKNSYFPLNWSIFPFATRRHNGCNSATRMVSFFFRLFFFYFKIAYSNWTLYREIYGKGHILSSSIGLLTWKTSLRPKELVTFCPR